MFVLVSVMPPVLPAVVSFFKLDVIDPLFDRYWLANDGHWLSVHQYWLNNSHRVLINLHRLTDCLDRLQIYGTCS
jgi:hypothetical protein